MSDPKDVEETVAALVTALNSSRATLEYIGKTALEASVAFGDFLRDYSEANDSTEENDND